MSTRRRKWLLAMCAGVSGFIAYALVGGSPPRAMDACRAITPVMLTGTLLEVRQGETVVPNDTAILEGLPRYICVSGDGWNPDSTSVSVTDCAFPSYAVTANLVP